MTKFKTYTCDFATLNDFEIASNRLGKEGWQLFAFLISGPRYVAVWTAAYQDSINSYGQYSAKQVIV